MEYQNGAITALQLQQRRFDRWAQRLRTAPETSNAAFLAAMAELCEPLDGAVALLLGEHDRPWHRCVPWLQRSLQAAAAGGLGPSAATHRVGARDACG
ncbi:hypothetical protein ACFQGW_15405 [Xanthomonas theicola]|uniref:hypothetical protein n=1 Tax=Xanthomonas theicola TaxID=56464 RepID=UPI001FEC0CAE|nr:hypothetical protein [Xanthomonas theicola]